MKFSTVCDIVIAEEIRRKYISKEYVVGSTLAVTKGKDKIESENDGSSSSNKKWKNMNKKIECFYCRKKGHFKSQRRKLAEDQEEKKKHKANVVEIDDEISGVCVCVESNTKNSTNSSQ